MDELFKIIDSEKDNRFKKKWTKLEKGDKLNRLELFISEEVDKNDLDEKQHIQLKTLLKGLFKKNNLSKCIDIEYSIEEMKILTITNLVYDEDNKLYTFNLPKKSVKPVSKSKSNVDRHFSRSKENKEKN
tara:strand:+ start:5967 stop:6356 length:390 start_codon:yes stop_codon:yes gene_type:complete